MVANCLFAYLDQSECKTVREIEAGESVWLMGNIVTYYASCC